MKFYFYPFTNFITAINALFTTSSQLSLVDTGWIARILIILTSFNQPSLSIFVIPSWSINLLLFYSFVSPFVLFLLIVTLLLSLLSCMWLSFSAISILFFCCCFILFVLSFSNLFHILFHSYSQFWCQCLFLVSAYCINTITARTTYLKILCYTKKC